WKKTSDQQTNYENLLNQLISLISLPQAENQAKTGSSPDSKEVKEPIAMAQWSQDQKEQYYQINIIKEKIQAQLRKVKSLLTAYEPDNSGEVTTKVMLLKEIDGWLKDSSEIYKDGLSRVRYTALTELRNSLNQLKLNISLVSEIKE